MAVPVRGAVFLNIPHALSEETLDFLLSLENPEFSRVLPEPGDILGWCKLQEQAERYAMPQSDLLIERFGPAIAGFSLGGIPVLDIRPRNWAQENKIAIYLHGGGFTLYSAASTLGHAVVLADDMALRTISVDYTLAPLASFEQITSEVVTAVRTVLEEGYRPEDILMLGDASGAALALAVILKARNLGLGLPAAAVLLSPGIDLRSADDTDYTQDQVSSFDEGGVKKPNELHSSWERWGTRSSQLYADFFKGFPATIIQGSTQDAALHDFFRLYHVLDLAGVQVRLDLYEHMPHGFQFRNPDAPESHIARQKLAEFARIQLTRSGGRYLSGKDQKATLEILRAGKKNRTA